MRSAVEHMDQLHLLAKTLLERETLDGDQLHKLLSGQELPPIPAGNGPDADGILGRPS